METPLIILTTMIGGDKHFDVRSVPTMEACEVIAAATPDIAAQDFRVQGITANCVKAQWFIKEHPGA